MRNRCITVLSFALLISLILSGCSAPAPQPAPSQTTQSSDSSVCQHVDWVEYNSIAHQCNNCGMKEEHVWKDSDEGRYCSVCYYIDDSSSEVSNDSSVTAENSEDSKVEVSYTGPISTIRGVYCSPQAAKIKASSAEASSELYTSTETFYASYAIDGKVTTSWQECAPNSYGPGEWIKISYSKPEVINVIGFDLGNRAAMQYFRENGVPKSLQLETSGGDTIQCSFEWIYGTQYIFLSHPVETSWIKVTLKDFFDAELYTDTCISEITAYYDEAYALSASKESNPMVQTGGLKVCVNCNGVNIRKGPGTNFEVAEVLNEGKTMTILEMTADSQWGRYEDNGESRWVNLGLVDYTSGEWNGFPIFYNTSCLTSLHNWDTYNGVHYRCIYCEKERYCENGKVYSYSAVPNANPVYLYDAAQPSKVDKYQ